MEVRIFKCGLHASIGVTNPDTIYRVRVDILHFHLLKSHLPHMLIFLASHTLSDVIRHDRLVHAYERKSRSDVADSDK